MDRNYPGLCSTCCTAPNCLAQKVIVKLTATLSLTNVVGYSNCTEDPCGDGCGNFPQIVDSGVTSCTNTETLGGGGDSDTDTVTATSDAFLTEVCSENCTDPENPCYYDCPADYVLPDAKLSARADLSISGSPTDCTGYSIEVHAELAGYSFTGTEGAGFTATSIDQFVTGPLLEDILGEHEFTLTQTISSEDDCAPDTTITMTVKVEATLP